MSYDAKVYCFETMFYLTTGEQSFIVHGPSEKFGKKKGKLPIWFFGKVITYYFGKLMIDFTETQHFPFFTHICDAYQ